MSKVPTVRNLSYAGLIPPFACMGLMGVLGWLIVGETWGVTVGFLLFIAYTILARRLIARDQIRGMKLLHKGEHQEALACFERSYDFFSEREWIDRFRAFTMMTPTALCYREMALCNIAYCHGQMGEGAKLKATLRRTLDEFPENPLALAGLRSFEAIENSKSEPGEDDSEA